MPEPLPIACSLSADDAAERLRSFRELAAGALLHVEGRDSSIELTFRAGAEVEKAVLAFIEAERQCCPFLDFELARGTDLRLRIGGPEEARPVLDAFLGAATH